ncbi:hypothetical protein L873DRAFT_1673422 [Choiromyces venosus 120613-1]|uniref:Transcription factor IIIC 90kDa subunit N-terminal domain-containing protein n=1 Tax=Choiromyces venosus 120613-1 TaxID=1336337 RepID=A0A3N4JZN4_9PEZI|nr:hypothetical protein L873DRAFT_1673422 [Choiromyces venosus 120613-1]
MYRDIRLRLFPNHPNALSWSRDGQLCVIASETAQILIPNDLKPHHASLRTHLLRSIQTSPEVAPADAEVYSIGDEQGPGYARAAAWSPLGVSGFRRCILGILTTNHQVKVFVPGLDPWSDWVIHYDLTKYLIEYSGWGNDELNEKGEVETTLRMRARTRSFSWSSEATFPASRWGESLLAVANDNLEIVLFRITHDHCSIVKFFKGVDLEIVRKVGLRETWVSCLAWSPWKRVLGGDEGDNNNNKSKAFLAFGFRGKVYICPITASLESGDCSRSPEDHDPSRVSAVAGNRLVVGNSMSDVHPVSAIAWAEEEISGCLILAYAIPRSVKIVAISSDGGVMSTREFVNGFVDHVAGFCFTPSTSPSRVMLHLASSNGRTQIIDYTPPSGHMSEKSTSHITEGVGDEQDVPMSDAPPGSREEEEELRDIASRWTNVLEERKQDYMAEHDLSTCTSRVYGIAASPMGGIIAVACSFHPNDSLQYITASKEMTKIVFGTHHGWEGAWQRRGLLAEPPSDEPRVPTPIQISSEAFLFEIECFGGRSAGIADRIRKSLDKVCFPDGNGWDLKSISIQSTGVGACLASNLLAKRELNALRYKCCLETISDPANPRLSLLINTPPKENPEIIAHIICNILSVPRNSATERSNLSIRIIYSLACIGILGLYNIRPVVELAQEAFLWLSTKVKVDVRREVEISDRRISDLEVMERGEDDGSGLQEIRDKDKGFTSRLEKCALCDQGMTWSDLRVAECSYGHRVSRCTLTFLPMKDYKLTKECMVCKRTVLSEAILDHEVENNSTSTSRNNGGDGGGSSGVGDEGEMDDGGNTTSTREAGSASSSSSRRRGSSPAAASSASQGGVGVVGRRGDSTLAASILTGLDVCVHCGGRYWTRGEKG